MAAANEWRILEPDTYYRSFIESQKRPDGRSWTECRPLCIKAGAISTAEGSATVRMGNTSVVCGIKAEIATPTLREPDKGFFVPNVELYPCCSAQFKPGPPGEKAMSASRFLQNIIANAGVINLKDLCIVPNKVAWCIYCDIICLDYDGNLLDAALISLVTALQDLKLPTVELDAERDTITVSTERKNTLQVQCTPVATSFSIYTSDIQLVDPTAEDETESTGLITIVLKDDGSVCCVHKPGGEVISNEAFNKFVRLANGRLKKTLTSIRKALKSPDAQ